MAVSCRQAALLREAATIATDCAARTQTGSRRQTATAPPLSCCSCRRGTRPVRQHYCYTPTVTGLALIRFRPTGDYTVLLAAPARGWQRSLKLAALPWGGKGLRSVRAVCARRSGGRLLKSLLFCARPRFRLGGARHRPGSSQAPCVRLGSANAVHGGRRACVRTRRRAASSTAARRSPPVGPSVAASLCVPAWTCATGVGGGDGRPGMALIAGGPRACEGGGRARERWAGYIAAQPIMRGLGGRGDGESVGATLSVPRAEGRVPHGGRWKVSEG